MNQQTYFLSWRKGLTLSATFLLALAVGVSCKKHTNTLGLGALDPNALLASGGVDSFQLKTFTVAEDSTPTDNQVFALLGAFNDPKIGTTDASFYAQFHLANSVSFQGETVNVDSVVLSLRYRGYYGNLDPQTFQVYELTESLHEDSTYYKSTTKTTDGVNLVQSFSQLQTPNPTDSVAVGGGKLPAQLRLHLDTVFGQQIMEDAITNNPSAFTSDESFEAYFKGLQVKVANPNPASGKGAALYFNLNDNQSKVTIYYHVVGDVDQTTYELVLEVDGTCADFNHVEITNIPAVSDVISNPINGQTQYYAQASKSRGVIEFPTVNNLPKTSVIHNALLVVPIAHQTSSAFYPSTQLTIGYLNDDGEVIGFKVVAYDDATKSYIVDVRNYVQDIVSGTAENRGVYLFPTFFSSTTERIIFNGPNTSNKEKPKLIVKYTEY